MQHSQDLQNSIIINDGITQIEHDMFDNPSNITSVYLPNSVTHISDGAFSGCSNLKHIVLPDHLFTADHLFTFRGINPKINIYKQTRLNQALQVTNSLNLIGSYSDFQKYLISETVMSEAPSLELFKKAYQFILPSDFMDIIRALKEKESTIPTEVESFHTKLKEMGHSIKSLDFLPVIRALQTAPPTHTAERLCLFGNEKSAKSTTILQRLAHKEPSREPKPSKRQRLFP